MRARLRSVELDASAPHFHVNLGSLLSRLGRAEEAVDCFERALRLKVDYPEPWMNLGVALGKLGRHKDAVEAARLRPANAEALHQLGAGAGAPRPLACRSWHWKGDSYLSHHGLMLLTNLGLGNLVARDEEQYVQIAASLARKCPRVLSATAPASPAIWATTTAGRGGSGRPRIHDRSKVSRDRDIRAPSPGRWGRRRGWVRRRSWRRSPCG